MSRQEENGEPPSAADASATTPAAAAPRQHAADALGGDATLEALFWRARAEELAGQLARVERRLLALSRRLPGRWARLLACEPGDLPDCAPWPDPLAGWHETTELESAHVAIALPRLWDRLDPDASR
jgi:hypothetical protein